MHANKISEFENETATKRFMSFQLVLIARNIYSNTSINGHIICLILPGDIERHVKLAGVRYPGHVDKIRFDLCCRRLILGKLCTTIKLIHFSICKLKIYFSILRKTIEQITL